MFNIFNWFKTTDKNRIHFNTTRETMKMNATINHNVNGKFDLYHGSTFVTTYSRKRDAIRGATRRGYTLENA